MKRTLAVFLAAVLLLTLCAPALAQTPLMTLLGGKVREENTDGTGDCIKSGPVPHSYGTFIRQIPMRIGEVPAKNLYGFFAQRFPDDMKQEDFPFQKAFLAKAEEFVSASPKDAARFQEHLTQLEKDPFTLAGQYTLTEGDTTWTLSTLYDGVQRWKMLILQEIGDTATFMTADMVYRE